jgi:hypothetical protein
MEEGSVVDYMKYCSDFYSHNFNHEKCSECGGTGIIPMMCCNGHECNCMGYPVDFKTQCGYCGKQHILPERLVPYKSSCAQGGK